MPLANLRTPLEQLVSQSGYGRCNATSEAEWNVKIFKICTFYVSVGCSSVMIESVPYRTMLLSMLRTAEK